MERQADREIEREIFLTLEHCQDWSISSYLFDSELFENDVFTRDS